MPAKDDSTGSAAFSGSSPQELRQKAETGFQEIVSAATGEVEALTPEAARIALHELRVHQIELEMQNEELRRAYVELAAMRARYFDLYDLAPVGYCTLSGAGLILEVNLTAATLLGLPTQALVKRPFSRFLHTEDADRYHLLCTQLRKTGEPQSCELRMMVGNDGKERWVHLAATRAPGEGGDPELRIVLTDIGELKRTESALHSLLGEKIVLLGEVHHRVKNNLQLFSSLLRLESSRSVQPETKASLLNMQARVRAMAVLHEALHHSGPLASLDLGDYIRRIVTQSYEMRIGSPGVKLRFDLASVEIGMNQGCSIGLLVTELVSNCFKYGFTDGRSGEVCVELQPGADHAQWHLRVSDTGIGLPADFAAKWGSSLGLQLVSDLVKQIGGVLVIGPEPSAVFSITFTAAKERSPAPPES
jgi:PAS domain S-box-containing protein